MLEEATFGGSPLVTRPAYGEVSRTSATLDAGVKLTRQMGRVAGPAKPGSKGQVAVRHGRFQVWYLPKYEEGLKTVLDGLAKAEKLYEQAHYRLPNNIPVVMAARPWGSQRSIYTTANGGFIQLVPEAFADKGNFATFVHELAHYLHSHGVPGGFANRTIHQQFDEMMSAKPSDTGGSRIEQAQDALKALDKEYAQIAKAIRPGLTLNLLFRKGFGFNAPEAIRPVKVVQKKGRGDRISIVVEFLEPTPEERVHGIRGDTLPLHVFVKKIDNPQIAAAWADLESRRNKALEAYNDAVLHGDDTSRYEDHRSTWFPTDYSKENSLEWFAELVTARLLAPSKMDPVVKEWLDQVVKTGNAPGTTVVKLGHHHVRNACPGCGAESTCRCRTPKTVLTHELCFDCRAAASRIAARYKNKKEVPKADGEGTTTVYEYSEKQVQYRNREKAKRVEKLRHNIGKLRKQVKKDLTSEDPKTRFTALAIGLIDETYERVGNDESAKEGHFGVTGWRKKHVTFSGGKAIIKYVGKSGVKQEKVVEDKALVSALKKAVEGKSDNDPICEGEDCKVSAKDVNDYLEPFGVTAKDLRGFHANMEMQERLKAIRAKGGKLPKDKKEREKKLKEEFKQALEETAEAVGHEASTLRSQYLVPGLEDDYVADGTVDEKLDKKGFANCRDARVGTKTPAEKEDEAIENLSRPAPTKKPPRHDLRKERIDDEDTKPSGDEDKDLSLNYKKVARRFVAKIISDLLDEELFRLAAQARDPGEVWQVGDEWKGKNQEGEIRAFEDKDAAKAFAQGLEDDGGEDDDPPSGDKPEPDEDPDPDPDPEPKPDERFDPRTFSEGLDAKVKSVLGVKGAGVGDLLKSVLSDLDKDSAAKLEAAFEARLGDLAKMKPGADGVSKEVKDLATKALKNIDSLGKRGRGVDLGKDLAEIVFAKEIVANPMTLGGQKVLSVEQEAEALHERAIQAYREYNKMSPELRAECRNQLARRMEEFPEDSPEHAELSKILDGMVVASAVNGEDCKTSDGKELGRDISEQEKKLAQALAITGEAHLLIMSQEDFEGPKGREVIRAALDIMDDGELASFMTGDKEGPYQGIVEAFIGDDPPLGFQQKDFARNLLKDLAVMDMTTAQSFMRAFEEASDPKKPKRRTPGEKQDDFVAKVQAEADQAADFREILDNLAGHLLEDGGSLSEEEWGEIRDQVLQARMCSYYEAAQNHFKGDPDPSEPNIAKVRHICETGDLAVLDQVVVRQGEVPPSRTSSRFFQSSGYTGRDSSRGPWCARAFGPNAGSSSNWRNPTMPMLTKKGALNVTRDIDRLANLFETKFATLGLPEKVARDLARRLDLVADRIERTAGIDPQRKAAQADYDPSEINEEVSGPLEGDADESDYMGDEFTQQESRELRERVEGDELGMNTIDEPQKPQAGVQAAIKALATTSAKLASASARVAPANRPLAATLTRLAKAIVAAQEGLLSGAVSAENAVLAYKAASEILKHVQAGPTPSKAIQAKLAKAANLAVRVAEKAAKKAEDDEVEAEDDEADKSASTYDLFA